jgi:hypothetical protein
VRFSKETEKGGPFKEMMAGDNRRKAEAVLVAALKDRNRVFYLRRKRPGFPQGKYKGSELSAAVLARVHPGLKSVMFHSAVKGILIARGEADHRLLGLQKTGRFYYNLLNPETDMHATIDTWMMRGMTGDPHLGKTTWRKGAPEGTLYGYDAPTVAKILDFPRKKIGKSKADRERFAKLYRHWIEGAGSYPFFEEIVQQVAHEYGMKPHQVQAIVWEYVKKTMATQRPSRKRD